MTETELLAHLRAHYPREDEGCEWKEFKTLTHAVSGRKGEDIASYCSAIANMAGGHLLIGVADRTLAIVGIQDFHDYTPENLAPRLLGRCTNLSSEGLRVEPFTTSDTGKTVWVLHIPPHAPRLPVYAHDKAWQRVGDSLSELRPERRKSILEEPIEVVDWSAQTVPGASVADLEPAAIAVARAKFKERRENARYVTEVDGWDDVTFLDKARLTAGGRMTRAALLLLGRPESAHFLLPYPAQITWKLEAEERAYEHFGPPFLLNTTEVLGRIRNIKTKLFPDDQLLATEVSKYDTRVILEALHNCLAHQDYTQNARVLVTERVERLIFENAGGFFEGHAEDYVSGERTPQRYRNPWLAQAMVSLGMIDTMGYGIHSMFLAQRKRFFPLPDYARSTDRQVVLEVYGHAIDLNYTRLLLQRQDLDLGTVVLLDRVQKKYPIPVEAVSALRRAGLIEGRKPNFYVSAHIAAATNTQAAYTRNRGMAKAQLKQFVLNHVQQFGSATRGKLEELLLPLLPQGLDDAAKSNKVKNLLTEMRAVDKTLICHGRGPAALWRLAGESSNTSDV